MFYHTPRQSAEEFLKTTGWLSNRYSKEMLELANFWTGGGFDVYDCGLASGYLQWTLMFRSKQCLATLAPVFLGSDSQTSCGICSRGFIHLFVTASPVTFIIQNSIPISDVHLPLGGNSGSKPICSHIDRNSSNFRVPSASLHNLRHQCLG